MISLDVFIENYHLLYTYPIIFLICKNATDLKNVVSIDKNMVVSYKLCYVEINASQYYVCKMNSTSPPFKFEHVGTS